jgi:hypothetical protein
MEEYYDTVSIAVTKVSVETSCRARTRIYLGYVALRGSSLSRLLELILLGWQDKLLVN